MDIVGELAEPGGVKLVGIMKVDRVLGLEDGIAFELGAPVTIRALVSEQPVLGLPDSGFERPRHRGMRFLGLDHQSGDYLLWWNMRYYTGPVARVKRFQAVSGV